jgi:hypothetical protein
MLGARRPSHAQDQFVGVLLETEFKECAAMTLELDEMLKTAHHESVSAETQFDRLGAASVTHQRRTSELGQHLAALTKLCMVKRASKRERLS